MSYSDHTYFKFNCLGNEKINIISSRSQRHNAKLTWVCINDFKCLHTD